MARSKMQSPNRSSGEAVPKGCWDTSLYRFAEAHDEQPIRIELFDEAGKRTGVITEGQPLHAILLDDLAGEQWVIIEYRGAGPARSAPLKCVVSRLKAIRLHHPDSGGRAAIEFVTAAGATVLTVEPGHDTVRDAKEGLDESEAPGFLDAT